MLNCFTALVKRRVLAKRGAYDRLLEIKPDVIRDHILRDWLVAATEFGKARLRPTDTATALVRDVSSSLLDGTIDDRRRAVLSSVARVQMQSRGSDNEVDLLSPFFEAIINAAPTMGARTRVRAAETITDIAFVAPSHVIGVSKALRSTEAPSEREQSIFGTHTTDHRDVIQSLAWPVFHAAMGANTPQQRTAVLKELSELVRAEAKGADVSLPNDGKRADRLLSRAIQGGPHFLSSYTQEAIDLASEVVTGLKGSQSLAPGSDALFKTLVGCVTAVERHQTFSEEWTITLTKRVIHPKGLEWSGREKVIGALRAALEPGTLPTEIARRFWSSLAEAHRSLNAVLTQLDDQDVADAFRTALVDDLTWAAKVLNNREASLGTLKAARKMWDWHRQFDKDPEFVSAAKKLEDLYLGKGLVQEFGAFEDYEDPEHRRNRSESKADELCTAKDSGSIRAFVSRAAEFFGKEQVNRVFEVAGTLGLRAADSPGTQAFVRESLTEPPKDPLFRFACVTARRWLSVVRKTEGDMAASALANELFGLLATAASRVEYASRCYSLFQTAHDGPIGERELALVFGTLDAFLEANVPEAFCGVYGWTVMHDWDRLRESMEKALDATAPERLPTAVARLIESIGFGTNGNRRESEPPPPSGLGEWVLDQLLRLPDIDDLGGNAGWHLDEILKRTDRPGVEWLVAAIERRDRLSADVSSGARAFPIRLKLSGYVKPLGGEATPQADQNKSEVARLLSMIDRTDGLDYVLPEYARELDPHGVLVPQLVVEMLREMPSGDHERFWRWARFGGVYAENTPAWRTIAKEVCAAAGRAEEAVRVSFFNRLTNTTGAWTGVPGEVASVFHAAVDRAETDLRAEKDSDIRLYWEWSLKVAKAELARESEHAREVRGE